MNYVGRKTSIPNKSQILHPAILIYFLLIEVSFVAYIYRNRSLVTNEAFKKYETIFNETNSNDLAFYQNQVRIYIKCLNIFMNFKFCFNQHQCCGKLNCSDFYKTDINQSCFDITKNGTCYDWVPLACHKLGSQCNNSTVYETGCYEIIETKITHIFTMMLIICSFFLLIIVSLLIHYIMINTIIFLYF